MNLLDPLQVRGGVAESGGEAGMESAIERDPGEIFRWPIVTVEDEEAILSVLRAGTMSGTDITKAFESEWSEYLGVEHSLGYCNGTAALQSALYVPEQLGGLPVEDFIAAVAAEGAPVARGVNPPLHLHPLFNSADVYGDGTPTRNAFSDRDLRQGKGSLPVAEQALSRSLGVPWFKHDWPDEIEKVAGVYRKVAERFAASACWTEKHESPLSAS